MFNDRTGLAASRSTASFLIQEYQRDTGEVMFDLSVPLLVRGQHWGCVRIGYTTFNLIAGLHAPSGGSIQLDGREIAGYGTAWVRIDSYR